MYFISVLITFLSVLSITAGRPGPEKREQDYYYTVILAGDVILGITELDKSVLKSQATIESSNGTSLPTSLTSGTPTLNTLNDIRSVVSTVIYITNHCWRLNEPEGNEILDHINSTLVGSIPEVVRTIVSKKDAFIEAGQQPAVLGSLYLMLMDHDKFSGALYAKLPKGYELQGHKANAALNKIHDAIQQGINACAS